MKETISTIPLIEAFEAKDECPLCYLERLAEEHAISFILGPGASYMEGEIREKTDQTGFCRQHYKKMYDYGNRLGSAMILQTHIRRLNREMADEFEHFRESGKPRGFFPRKVSSDDAAGTSLGTWIDKNEKSCYICDHFKEVYDRYLDTFMQLFKKDEKFRQLLADSQGFCLPHLRDLVELAPGRLSGSQKTEFYQVLFDLTRQNMTRIEAELEWFVDKFDYRNQDQSWKNSKDSVQRAMQKLAGGYPADPVFKSE